MPNTVRVALPGYDVFKETNLDNFSLYADTDNVLIKRFLQGTDTIASGSPTTKTHNHNLNYVPFFAAFADVNNDGTWWLLNNQYNPFSVPAAVSGIDTTKLSINNYQGASINAAYDIFYDDMDGSGTPSITESDRVFKVARPGKSAFSKNPNDYIMHSDLNNFKILKQGKTTSLSLPNGITSFSHGANITTPYKFFVFVKFPDGKVAILGTAGTYSYDVSKGSLICWIDGSKIYIRNFSSTTFSVDVAYIIYGTGVTGTIVKDEKIVAMATAGKNVDSTNPEDFNFHSKFATLKYYQSGSYAMTVSDTTTHTIAHNLGYIPFHIGFVNDLQGLFSSTTYALMPYYLGQSTLVSPNNDIAAYIYADSTNIYLKALYQTNAVGTSKTFQFYYKIFKNNLGL